MKSGEPPVDAIIVMHRLAHRYTELGVLTGSLFIAAVAYLVLHALAGRSGEALGIGGVGAALGAGGISRKGAGSKLARMQETRS